MNSLPMSGEFGSIAIDKVTVVERIRKKERTELQRAELRNSIAKNGLIHPIVINREATLVAGWSRLVECLELGWSHIPYQFADTLSERELLSIEIEENVKRVDLDWKDQCDALLRYHTMHVEDVPSWTQNDTAEAIGYSRGEVAKQLAVARELSAGNTRVQAAPKMSIAKGIVERQAARKKQDELSAIQISVEGENPSKPASPFQVADFLEWAYDYDGPAFNFLHCDFPYGIDADTFNQGAAASYGGYKDTFEHYAALVAALVENKEALLGNSAHVIFWFSMKHYAWTLEKLSKHFWVDPYPLIWHKSDNKGTLPDPQRGPRRVYEVAFLCSHGDRKIISSVSNVFSGPTSRTGEHMSEKSPDMLAHFFRMVCDASTRLLDPTSGSGSALRAARSLGCTSLLGLEMNPEYVDNARRAFEQ